MRRIRVGNLPRMQHFLTKILEDAAFQRLKSSISQTHFIHLTACSAKWSSIWMRAIPHCHSLRLSNSQFSIAFRLRLSLVPLTPPSAPCAGCGTLLHLLPFHALHCPVGSQYLTLRHDSCNQTLASECRALGAATTIEPQTIVFSDNRHPDCAVVAGNTEYMLDVTVRSPLAPSYNRIASLPLGVAKAAEAQKIAKYAKQIDEQNASFVPFALEALGGWGPAACNFAHNLAIHAEQSTDLSRNEALMQFVQAVSMSIQRGNARLLLGAYQKARSFAED
jgi:hypothetical protein